MEKRREKYARHAGAVTGMPCACLTLSGADAPGGDFCAACAYSACRPLSTHLYGCHESYRWDGQFIYYCPLGLVFAAASLTESGGELTGALISGPCVMGELEDTLAVLSCPEMAEAVACLPVFTPQQVGDRAALLTAVAHYCSDGPQSRHDAIVREQSKLLSDMYVTGGEEPPDVGQELIGFENKLRSLVIAGDKAGAQLLLNELLGRIYFYSGFDHDRIRARITELLVVLSRATIEAGADIGQVFLLSSASLRGIDALTDMEELSVRVSALMHRFISYSFDMPSVRLSDVVHRVMHYVRAHIDEKITLDEIARQVYLSRTYVSGVFKAQTGTNLSAYITSVRLEKSRKMLAEGRASLAEIAAACGFEDQSYFSRVFKKAEGISPKKYRDSRGG